MCGGTIEIFGSSAGTQDIMQSVDIFYFHESWDIYCSWLISSWLVDCSIEASSASVPFSDDCVAYEYFIIFFIVC